MDSPALNLEDNLDQVFNELENCETHIDRQRYKEDYVAHQTTYEGTPLSFVKKFLAWSNPQDNQTVYDLGSGLGRVIIYGALNCPAIFKGIEIVPERVKMSQLISKKLELKNAVFYCVLKIYKRLLKS